MQITVVQIGGFWHFRVQKKIGQVRLEHWAIVCDAMQVSLAGEQAVKKILEAQ